MWYLFVVLIWISQMMLGITFMCFFAICVSSLVNVYSNILLLLSELLFFDSRLVYNIKLASRIGQKAPSVQLSFLHTSVIFRFFCVCSYLYDSYISKYALAVWSHFTQLLTYLLKIALINELNISHIILPRVIKLVH